MAIFERLAVDFQHQLGGGRVERYRSDRELHFRKLSAGTKIHIADPLGRFELPQHIGGDADRRTRYARTPRPGTARDVDERFQVGFEERIEHAAGGEQPAEIRYRHIHRAAGREGVTPVDDRRAFAHHVLLIARFEFAAGLRYGCGFGASADLRNQRADDGRQ